MNRFRCSCLLCRNEIQSSNLKIHYGSKQCLSGKLFKDSRSDRSLNCSFCSFIGVNKNSAAQHEICCEMNPNRITKAKVPSYGMKGKKGSNQFLKAKKLGLPPPIISDETKIKMRKAWMNNPKAYSSKEATRAIETVISLLDASEYGTVLYGEKEFWLRDADKFYFYDCCFRDVSIIIEYQGTAYHPKSLDADFKVPYKNMGTVADIWKKDRDKEELAKKKGFLIEYIWSDNVDNDINRVVQIIRQKLHS